MITSETVYLVAEEVGQTPDEAYAKVVHELSQALRARSSVIVHLTPPRPEAGTARRGAGRMRAIANRQLWSAIRRARPGAVVYLSRSSTTLAGLARSRILGWMGWRARTVMIGLQPRPITGNGRLLARLLWPDLLLVTTSAEADQARRLGARADVIATGVDLDRFRPPREGEKSSLRRKWGIDPDARVLLHVGHLTSGRNLEDLAPLAGEPRTRLIVVASSQRDPESDSLQKMLEDAGATVIRGYTPEVDEIYRLADCYVFPTRSPDHAIAMPLSVLEAMATGLPVVTTRFGALGERFADVPGMELVDDRGQISGAIQRVMSGPKETRSAAGAFTWDSVAARVAAACG